MAGGKDQMDGLKLEQRHGKERVRVGRVWRSGKDGRQYFVEWNVSIGLLSDCLDAYVRADNSNIVATDTMKNTVYVKAKECSKQVSVEEFAIILAKHFTSFYTQVTTAIINLGSISRSVCLSTIFLCSAICLSPVTSTFASTSNRCLSLKGLFLATQVKMA